MATWTVPKAHINVPKHARALQWLGNATNGRGIVNNVLAAVYDCLNIEKMYFVSPVTFSSRMDLLSKPKSELSEQDLERLEEYEIAHGPLSVLQRAVDEGSQVLISLRNNHKLLAHIKAFDRHCNMVLINVKEMWTESPVNARGKRGRPVPRDKFIAKLFLRGDGVILVVRA